MKKSFTFLQPLKVKVLVCSKSNAVHVTASPQHHTIKKAGHKGIDGLTLIHIMTRKQTGDYGFRIIDSGYLNLSTKVSVSSSENMANIKNKYKLYSCSATSFASR